MSLPLGGNLFTEVIGVHEVSEPQVTSMVLSTGTCVPLSFDLETGTPVEIYLTGNNLQNLDDIQLDSGPSIGWYITGVSTSNNTAIITAYATGEAGAGYLQVRNRSNPIADLIVDDFWIPLFD